MIGGLIMRIQGWAGIAVLAVLVGVFVLGVVVGSDRRNPTGLASPPGQAADNVVLTQLAPRAYPAGVWRTDYASGNGAPPMFFKPLSSSCADNHLVDDGGSCVDATDGDSWKGVFDASGVDWREWGVVASAGDNHVQFQAALDAAFNQGAKLIVCGAGIFVDTATVYFHPTPVEWCSHQTILRRNFAGPVLVLTDAPGHSYPQAAIASLTLVRPTIDMNQSLWTTEGGAGIVISAVNGWKIDDPVVYNIPTRDTPAPAISGQSPPAGTFAYTNFSGAGWVPNAGIAMLGGSYLNVENGHLDGGYLGNVLWGVGTNACTSQYGANGLVLTIPSQQFTGGPNAGHNPPNANSFRNTILDCNSIGLRDDFGTGNDFTNLDTTYSQLYGYSIGTPGRYDLEVKGTASGSSTLGITFMSDGMTGASSSGCLSPARGIVGCSYTGTGDPLDAANALVSAINGNATLARLGVTAAVWPASITHDAVIHVDMGDEFSGWRKEPEVNFALCDNGYPPAAGCSGALTISAYHPAGWEKLSQSSGEDIGRAYLYIGANVRTWALDNPQQTSGTPRLIWHPHAGPDGSINPIITANRVLNAYSFGTLVSSDRTIDCENDQQPYVVSSPVPITLNIAPSVEIGATCQFIDANPGGGWATDPVTIHERGVEWGRYSVMNADSSTARKNYGQFSITLQRRNNYTTTLPVNNSGGDWIGGPSNRP